MVIKFDIIGRAAGGLMNQFTRILISLTLINLFHSFTYSKDTYRIAWSHYVGWEPWAFIQSSGILKKWADRYGIEIEVVLINDYIESVTLFTAGKFDGVTVTNMDALTIPAVGGVDTTALIIGDFSNGNDAIVMKNGTSVKDLKGRKVNLVELSVSHYLLARALDMNGLSEKDVKVFNTSDADIGPAFLTAENACAVTWNPILIKVKGSPGAKQVFDSSLIPGEIIDVLAVRTDAADSLKKALVGAWYDGMKVMSSNDNKALEAMQSMADMSGGSLTDFEKQLETTRMFYSAADAADFGDGKIKGLDLKKTMQFVRNFSFEHGLYGEDAENADFVGIEFPDGEVIGDQSNIKLRFDTKFMRLFAEGKLSPEVIK